MAVKKTKSLRLDSYQHDDSRTNIPTEELRGFVEEDEKAPKTLLYPRDPSLDPQLVWKGKDEQDREDLALSSVPIYIQEKIHPRALVEDLKRESAQQRQAGAGIAEDVSTYQINFFNDFNGVGLDFSHKIKFYEYDQHWTNRMILGDSLLVMASLAEKEGLKGRVQTIYADPPYGIKFGSNWQVSTRKRDVKDGSAADATRQPEQVKAFRDTWQLGIHSYLSYLCDRLMVARELLTETGSIFVQIGDENVHLVRSVMDEVFGSENFVSIIAITKAGGGLESASRVASRLDYIIWYAKAENSVKYRALYESDFDAAGSGFVAIELPTGERRNLTKEERSGAVSVPVGRIFRSEALTKPGPGAKYQVEWQGTMYDSGNRWWGYPKASIERLLRIGRVGVFGNTLRYVRYTSDFPLKHLSNLWEGFGGAPEPLYVVLTNAKIVERCILMTTDPGDLVLDPTGGSATTAYVAEQWGRRWITIDTSRVALALARTRLMAARFPYYLLQDSHEGVMKEAELAGQMPPPHSTSDDIRKGFVYKRVPHVTLKSIANNPDIREGMSREEIDQAIAKHADTEILYDQPYADPKTVRVSGPFTVESLSPHRVLSTADSDMDGVVDQRESDQHHDFGITILENLKKAGVQNTVKNERLMFDWLEPHPGRWINATGEYTDAEGNVQRVAVSLGPEHGTVGPDQIKEAAKEAVQGLGFDLLLVCGFAFDPHVSEEAKRYGKLTVVTPRMNTDLTMGNELLKKTGAGNLFMIFGEPDVEIATTPSGDLTVEIKGVDVYDPTTSAVRSDTTDEIACWFIDTEYDGESFFVRHAYFTGADEPYDKLKRALRAEIDEGAWASLYSTVSRPFPRPESGKIAVKVINHYGDEVLKVYEV